MRTDPREHINGSDNYDPDLEIPPHPEEPIYMPPTYNQVKMRALSSARFPEFWQGVRLGREAAENTTSSISDEETQFVGRHKIVRQTVHTSVYSRSINHIQALQDIDALEQAAKDNADVFQMPEFVRWLNYPVEHDQLDQDQEDQDPI